MRWSWSNWKCCNRIIQGFPHRSRRPQWRRGWRRQKEVFQQHEKPDRDGQRSSQQRRKGSESVDKPSDNATSQVQTNFLIKHFSWIKIFLSPATSTLILLLNHSPCIQASANLTNGWTRYAFTQITLFRPFFNVICLTLNGGYGMILWLGFLSHSLRLMTMLLEQLGTSARTAWSVAMELWRSREEEIQIPLILRRHCTSTRWLRPSTKCSLIWSSLLTGAYASFVSKPKTKTVITTKYL